MKKFTTIFILFFAICITAFGGNGTVENPYTVSEAIKVKNTTQTYYVQGFIVGEMRDYSNGKYFYEIAPPFGGTLAYLLADNPAEIDRTKCIPIQSKEEYGDLYSNPEFWRKQAVANGTIKEFYGMPGLKNLTEFQILDAEPLYNEAANWNFFEDFDAKGYTPASTQYTFAGGTYIGDSGTWLFKGATWGDTGKDQKWERAAARIRLTEGATGEAGYIQMEENKPNGIGFVRFWAGNYEEDTSGGALALFVSNDNGASWERVAHSQNITRTWKEYEFNVGRPGDLKLRIAKDETGSKGINVDKVRISDYYQLPNGVENTKSDTYSILSNKNGIAIHISENTLLSVFSVSGELVSQSTYSPSKVFITLSKGYYIVKINNSVDKIIVQ
jgi:hypothetical protein